MVFYHYNKTIFLFEPYVLNRLVKFGNESVNFFFFLSGFIMVIAHNKFINDDTALNKKKYWITRFERIYPVYFLALMLIAFYYFVIDKSVFTMFSIRLLLESTLLQGWVDKTSLNYPGWSLSVELLFYLSFPFIFSYLKKKKLYVLFLISIALYLITQFLFYFLRNNVYIADNSVRLISIFPLFHLSTFIFGITLGLFFINKYSLFIKNIHYVKMFTYLLATIILIAIYFLNIFPHYHYVGLLTPVYFCFLLGFSLESKFTKLLSNKFFIFLGNISYSIYILQIPVWLYFKFIVYKFGIIESNFYFYLITLFLFSSAIYYLYELPMKKWIATKIIKLGIIS